MVWIYALASVICVSSIALFVSAPFFIKKKISNNFLLFLLSVSVGVLLTTVFVDFLPEVISHGYTLELGLSILLGFMLMFVLERLIHWHHAKKCGEQNYGHGHAYSIAPINLIGDGIHNFIDGLIIAGSYTVDLSLGITTTISVIFHEIPQEIADFGILLYSGLPKKKALLFNFLATGAAVFGTVVGLVLAEEVEGFAHFIIPFAVGNFIYIAACNLAPQLHRHCTLKDTMLHLAGIIFGVVIIVLVTLYAPAHGHV